MPLKIEKFKGSYLYRCRIFRGSDERFRINEAWLTQPIRIGTRSEWSAASESSNVGLPGYLLQRAKGITTQTWFNTYQAWQGSQPLDISFSFTFIAVNDAAKEVMEPTRKILGWPLSPTRDTPMKTPFPIEAPGSGRGMTVRAGLHFTMDQLLPVSSDVTYGQVYDKKGYPTKADVELQFTTMSAMSAKDVDEWFDGGVDDGGYY